ncbi:hypothetical protein [Nodosilinea nodulosa]|uniref:hypothetical protein n=1 Tax=Nodosilinea nodulosa TaxID=416001 RepID=UPI0002E82C2A|nr:hypothetical protein [Nodosilinea nodulosa]
MINRPSLLQQRFIFLVCVTAIYSILVFWLDISQAPPLWDEQRFWDTSLTFSKQMPPSLESIRDYKELNTPLPFIIFGGLEYFFHGGIAAGRLLNIMLSMSIAVAIGWPRRENGKRSLLCLLGLLLCPYFLWYSRLLYTDIIACFWVLTGFIFYVKNRYLLSSLSFILAIASRQYMVAFPAAILTYEFIIAAVEIVRDRRIVLVKQWKWLAPLIAGLSLFGWFYLFQGLAPEAALKVRSTPEVQQTNWALTPGGAVNFLSFIGLYVAISEFLLFEPKQRFRNFRELLKQKKLKILLIAAGLLLYCIIFPPLLTGLGTTSKIANLISSSSLKIIFFYSLALLACLRFSRLNLMTLVVLFNSLIMMKAFPWDKYILPLAIAFWYLKSVGLEEQFDIFHQSNLNSPHKP